MATGARDRLFIGVFPTGISYADREREKHGDYARCAFLDFDTLTLDMTKDCPAALRGAIQRHAKKLQARRGEPYVVSASGQTVTLGRKLARDPQRKLSEEARQAYEEALGRGEPIRASSRVLQELHDHGLAEPIRAGVWVPILQRRRRPRRDAFDPKDTGHPVIRAAHALNRALKREFGSDYRLRIIGRGRSIADI